MHDGGGGGDFGGHHGGHVGGHSGPVSHHTPAHHTQHGADSQFMPWASTTTGGETSRHRRRDGGRDTPAAVAWSFIVLAVFVIVLITVLH